MGQLFFKKPFQDAIRAGRKRTTLRRGDRPRLKAGQRAYCPGLGWLKIESVEIVDLERLADEDAVADGFESLTLMRQTLLAIYPDQAIDGKRWFKVGFAREENRNAE